MRFGWGPLLFVAVGAAVGACVNSQPFNCQDDAGCGGEGVCETAGFCSFPDLDCESGRRYGDLAGAGLAGACVNPSAETETETVTDSGSATEASSSGPTLTTSGTSSETTTSTTSTDPTSTTTGPTTSTTAVADASTTDPSTSSSGGTSGSESGSTGPGEPYTFFDDFERPDNEMVGNGWVEKNMPVFSVVGGKLEIDLFPTDPYPGNMLYRPLTESVGDVEVAAVVEFTTGFVSGAAQIYARIQPDVINEDGLTAYLCFMSSSSGLALRRQEGVLEFDLESTGSIPPSEFGEPHRLRLRVQGANPVALECFLEILMGGGWQEVDSISALDGDPTAVLEAGATGLSTNTGLQRYTYDDFAATELVTP